MSKKIIKTATSEAMLKNYPWTIQAIADDLDMPIASFRVWKNKMEKDKKLPRPKIGSLLCIQDPSNKLMLRFSEKYLDNLRELRGKVRQHNNREQVSKTSLKHAILAPVVPIFDQNIANILLRRFKDEQGVTEFLKQQLNNVAKPVLNKIELLKRRQEEEMKNALAELDTPSSSAVETQQLEL